MSKKRDRTEYQKAYRLRNKERLREKARLKRLNNLEDQREKDRKRDELRKDYKKQHNEKYRKENADKLKEYYDSKKEQRKESTKAWRKNNSARWIATVAKRDALKKQAIPSWFDKESIIDVYKEAEYFGLEVDHIVPLQSDIVCGLHCFDNLQLLSRKDNAAKGNRYWPDMP